MTQNKIFLKIKDKVINNKTDILLIVILFVLSIIFFKNIIGTETLMNNVHYYHEQTFFSYNYKSAFNDGTLPFWTPYWYSGQPFYADSQVFFINLTFIFILLFKNIFLAINLSTLIYFFISGLSMYLLVKYLIDSRDAAFISSIIYMFNGLILGFVLGGNPSILEPYVLIPLIFLFVIKAKKSKNPVNYSILAGLLLAFQIFSGGALVLVYTFLLIGAYLALDLISSKFKTNLIKTIIIGLVLLFVLFGLSAIKLLPNYDFVKKTNRAQGLSYEEYIGQDYFVFKDFLKVFVVDKTTTSTKAHIGIVASLLVLLSLGFWRKRMVLYLLLTSIFILFLASGNFLAELFFKYVPTFSQTRHIGRVLFVVVFSASVLAGYGFNYIKDYAGKKFNISNKVITVGIIIIAGLILTELVFLKSLPQGFNIQDQLEENQLAKYLEQQKDKFRIASFDVNDIISFHGSSYYAHYGLETISGGGPLWVNDFIKYIAVAKNYNYSKLIGILNLKYAISTKEADINGFKLVKKFEPCNSCKINDAEWIAGPYLYENENFVPRYLLVKNSILIVGNNQQAQDFIYNILLSKDFDPKTTVIIQESIDTANNYNIDDLLKFNAIILLSQPAQSTMGKLQEYVNKDGLLLPNIFEGENALSQESLVDILTVSDYYKEINVKEYSTNKRVFELDKDEGWLVLSERFADFPGWKASMNGEDIKIYKADNVISAVYLDGEKGELKFGYKPESFRKGAIITALTTIILLIYFIYIRRKWQK